MLFLINWLSSARAVDHGDGLRTNYLTFFLRWKIFDGVVTHGKYMMAEGTRRGDLKNVVA